MTTQTNKYPRNNITPIASRQDAFNRAWERLITHFDWGQSVDDASVVISNCLYRTADGNSCVIGYMFPDELYESCLENIPACDIVMGNSTKVPLDKHNKIQKFFCSFSEGPFYYYLGTFYSRLQLIHDKKTNWNCKEWMLIALREFAKTWDLTCPE
mgnify:CR=1 FL=1